MPSPSYLIDSISRVGFHAFQAPHLFDSFPSFVGHVPEWKTAPQPSRHIAAGMPGAADSVEFHYSPHPLFTLPTDNGLRHAIESPAPGIPANFPTPIKKIGDPI